MALEAATYIGDLNAANPVSGDGIGQGDDHIRLLKAVLKSTFPNVNGPVTTTDEELSNPFPVGGIIMWSGSIASIPAGWAICDGLNGTPNLVGLFVRGAGPTTPSVGSTGGNTQVTPTSSSAGAHTHTTDSQGGHTHGGATGGHALTVSELPAHDHGLDNALVSFTGVTTYSVIGDGGTLAGRVVNADQGGGQTHSHTIGSDGAHTHTAQSDGAHQHTVTVDVLPPFYALAFIMKL